MPRSIVHHLLCCLLVVQSVQASGWIRGSAVLLEASGEVRVDIPAEEISHGSVDRPIYFPGIFSCRAEDDASVLIHASNGVTLSFIGAGFFSVERMEEFLEADSETNSFESNVRMILNQRSGRLLVDGRALSESSKLTVETPFGRISSIRAILMIRIDYDYRSGIYDFAVSCAEGSLRLMDLRKQVYTIYAGQRISGAGSYTAPAIEVAEQTEDIREQFEFFSEKLESLDSERIDERKLKALQLRLPEVEADSADSGPVASAGPSEEIRRPRVIEFAPAAEAITPFRGEVKPPSDFQADLF